jgi:hypothetical protein
VFLAGHEHFLAGQLRFAAGHEHFLAGRQSFAAGRESRNVGQLYS